MSFRSPEPKARRGDLNTVGIHLMRMHPFLKHKVLSKSMRDLLYNSKFNRLNRPKRFDLSYPTSTLKPKTVVTKNVLKPLYLAFRRSVDAKGCPNNTDLLGSVLQDIQEIRYGKMLQTDEECAINGSWTAEVAGRRIDINSKGAQLSVRLKRPLQKRRRGFLGLDPWNATIRFPFRGRSNFVILNTFNSKENVMATFMGECRVCRSKPIVQGQWLMTRHSRDCEGLGATEQLIGDVWRQEKLCEIKDNRLETLKNGSSSNKKHNKVKGETSTLSMSACNVT